MNVSSKKTGPTSDKRIATFILALIVLIFLAGIGILVSTIVTEVRTARSLSRSSASAQGVVTKHTTAYQLAGSFNGYVEHRIDYRFSYQDDSGITKTQSLHNIELLKNDWKNIDDGDKIPVAYLKDNPSISRPVSTLSRGSPQLIRTLSVVMGVLFAIALMYFYQRYMPKRLQKKLLIRLTLLASIVLVLYAAAHLARMIASFAITY